MNITSMKIGHRFAAMLAIVVAGFVIYGASSFKVLHDLKVNGPTYQRIVQGKDLIADILPPPEYVIESYLVALQLMSAAPAERPALVENLKSLKSDYDTRRSFWIKENLDDALRNQCDLADKPAADFYQVAFSQFIPALAKNDSAAAVAALDKMKESYAAHRVQINKLVEMASKRNEVDEANAKVEIATSTWIMLAILVGAIGLTTLFSVVVTRGLMRQLGGEPAYAADIAGKIAAGDLAVEIATTENDESSLLFAIKSMRDSLANIVGQVRIGTETIATASSQIASGNLDLSSRTEKQASALGETATAMDELSTTVKQNADNAQQANLLASGTSKVAVVGSAVMSQVVDTMGSINESAKKIVDIISVIEGIAFQTNILALNAAVEAARAGEQGRGFAVVASEVRSLAQRSAAAAKEINVLISDSVQKVAAGSKLVDQAGSTMQEIVDGIQRVSNVVSEITTASHEQKTGIDQIHQAITQMDEVTQQNAALVEQAAAASGSLHEQADNLTRLVNVFRLAGSSHPVATPDRTLLRPPMPIGTAYA
jgi:methyl-accepting chemotaxis protein